MGLRNTYKGGQEQIRAEKEAKGKPGVELETKKGCYNEVNKCAVAWKFLGG